MRRPTHPARPRRRRPARGIALLAVLAVLAAACGGSYTDAEIIAGSGRLVEGTDGGGTGGTDGSTSSTIPGTGGGTDGSGSTTGGSTGGGAGGTTTGGPTGGVAPADVGTPGERGTIVIASVGTYSGPVGGVFSGIPRGVQLWAAAVNARGGLFGRRVEVIVADDGGDPAVHASTLQDLVENRGVVAFVGNGAGFTVDGAIGYLKGAGVPVFGSDCSRVEWYQQPMFFPQCPTPDDVVVGLVHSGIAVTGKRRFGFVTCTEAAACQGVKRTLLAQGPGLGAEMVYNEDVSLAQIDFTAQCRNAQAAGVEVMVLGVDANAWLRFARSCERQGFFPQYVGEATGTPQDPHSQKGLDDLIATGGVFAAHAARGGPFDAFQQAVDRYGDGKPTQAQALGWVAGQLFQEAAIRAARADGSLRPSTLLAAGHTFDHETLGGLTPPLTFTTSGAVVGACTFTEQADGKGGWASPLGPAPQCR